MKWMMIIVMMVLSGCSTPKMSVHFIDVGKGDATLYEVAGCTILIDAGYDDSNVVGYLKEHGITTLDIVIATHPDKDHIGGMSEVIDTFPITDFYLSNAEKEAKSYEQMMEALAKAQIQPIEVPKTFKRSCGPLTVEFLYPGADVVYEEVNEESIVTRISYQDFSITSLADLNQEALADLLKMKKLQPSTIVKASHHGDLEANPKVLYELLQPEVVIITSDANQNDGVPKKALLTMFDSLGIAYYRSDVDGTIIIESDGHHDPITMTE